MYELFLLTVSIEEVVHWQYNTVLILFPLNLQTIIIAYHLQNNLYCVGWCAKLYSLTLYWNGGKGLKCGSMTILMWRLFAHCTLIPRTTVLQATLHCFNTLYLWHGSVYCCIQNDALVTPCIQRMIDIRLRLTDRLGFNGYKCKKNLTV